jgi:hypothetical protein
MDIISGDIALYSSTISGSKDLIIPFIDVKEKMAIRNAIEICLFILKYNDKNSTPATKK